MTLIIITHRIDNNSARSMPVRRGRKVVHHVTQCRWNIPQLYSERTTTKPSASRIQAGAACLSFININGCRMTGTVEISNKYLIMR